MCFSINSKETLGEYLRQIVRAQSLTSYSYRFCATGHCLILGYLQSNPKSRVGAFATIALEEIMSTPVAAIWLTVFK